MNQAEKYSSGLRLKVRCHPDPVVKSADHDVTVENIGYDRYMVDILVRIPGISQSASLGFRNSGQTADVIGWHAGIFGPGISHKWTAIIDRNENGTSKAHSIRTTAKFAPEPDPLDDEPGPFDICECIIDVTVP